MRVEICLTLKLYLFQKLFRTILKFFSKKFGYMTESV